MPAEGERRAAARVAGKGGSCAVRLGREGRGLGFWEWEAVYIWRLAGGLQVGRRWGVVGQIFFAESPTTWLSAKRQF
jgi:hypothetical protein